MTSISYVFWDSDNTLTANGELHWRKHKEVAARHGVTLLDEHRKRIYQNNGAQNWVWMTTELGLKVGCTEYLKEVDAWYKEHAHEIEFRPGIPEALDMFEAAGHKQCVVSNGRRESVLIALKEKGIADRFDFILCKEDYEGRKPDPEPYLAALRRMEEVAGKKIDLAECLAIEDDPLGVTSASAAGMRVIHRRLNKDDAPAPEATANVFEKDEFLTTLRRYA